MKRIINNIKYKIFCKHSPLVICSVDLKDLPKLQEKDSVQIDAINMNDENNIKIWLEIQNDAFKRNWGIKECERFLLKHPHVSVLNTYFLKLGNEIVGIVSNGFFRKNKDIGTAHYLGLRNRAQGKGLGKYLLSYSYNELKKNGYKICEAETTIDRKRSLLIHFDFGFKPKVKFDYWNTPDNVNMITRKIVSFRLKKFYASWRHSPVKI